MHSIPDNLSIIFPAENLLSLFFILISLFLSIRYLIAASNVIATMNVYAIPMADNIPKSLKLGMLAERKERNETAVVIVASIKARPTSFIEITIASFTFAPLLISVK